MLFSTALKRSQRKPAPDRIPLSLPSAETNDFYTVELMGQDTEILVKNKLTNGYDCIVWHSDGSNSVQSLHIEGDRYKDYSLRIEHYYRGFQFTYTNPFAFIFLDLIRWYKVIVIKSKVVQSLYNSKKLTREERMDVLKYLIERKIENNRFEASVISMASVKKSHKWLYHPDKDRYRSHLQLILESFVESGDLKKNNYSYTVTGKALITLSEYELNMQRHADNVKSTKVGNRISSAILLVGLISVSVQVLMWGMDNKEEVRQVLDWLRSLFQ